MPKSLEKDHNSDLHQDPNIFDDTPVSEYLQTKQDEYVNDEGLKGIPLRNKLSELLPKPEWDENLKFGPIRDFSIDQWNGSPGLREWGYVNTPDTPDKIFKAHQNTRCNVIRGAYDGTMVFDKYFKFVLSMYIKFNNGFKFCRYAVP